MIESFPTFKQLFVRNQEIFVESSSPLSGAGFIVDVILCFLFFFLTSIVCFRLSYCLPRTKERTRLNFPLTLNETFYITFFNSFSELQTFSASMHAFTVREKTHIRKFDFVWAKLCIRLIPTFRNVEIWATLH